MRESKNPKKMKTVLAIHGYEPDVDILKFRIEESGYRFLDAANGQVGINRFKQERPDLVIVNASLPEQTGFDLCRQLKTKVTSHSVPIIILSEGCDINEKELATQCNADEYLCKRELCGSSLYDHPRFKATLQYLLGEIDKEQRDVISSETILLLSDNPDAVEDLVERLQGFGFSIITSVSLEETFAILQSTPTISCLLVDFDAEHIDITEITGRVKNLGRERAIMGIGDKVETSQPNHWRIYGVDGLLRKSTEDGVLKEAIELNINTVQDRNYSNLMLGAVKAQTKDLRNKNRDLRQSVVELTNTNKNLAQLNKGFDNRLAEKDKEVKRVRNEFKTIADSVTLLNNSVDLRASLQKTLRKVLSIIGIDYGCIILEREGNIETIAASLKTDKVDRMADLRAMTGHLLRTARKSSKVTFVEIISPKTQQGKMITKAPALFALCQRVEFGGQPIGVICLIGKEEDVRNIKHENFILGLTGYLAMVVKNNLLMDELHQHEKELAVFNAITDVVKSNKPDQLLPRVLESVVQTLGLQGGVFHYFDEIRCELHLVASTKLPNTFSSRINKMQLSNDQLNSLPIKTGKIVISENLSKHILFGSPSKSTIYRSAVCMPLDAYGKSAGIITLFSRDVDHFSQKDIDLYATIGQHLSEVYELNLLNRARTRKQLENYVIANLAQDIAASESMESAQTAIVNNVANLGYSLCFLGVLDRAGTRIRISSYRSKGGMLKQIEQQLHMRLKGLWIPVGGMEILSELKSGKAVVDNGVSFPNDKVAAYSFDELAADIAKVMIRDHKKMWSPKSFALIDSMIIVPIIIEEKFFGVLSVINSESLNNDDVSFLGILADTVGQSLKRLAEFKTSKAANLQFEKLLECTKEASLIFNRKTEIFCASRATASIFGVFGDPPKPVKLETISPHLAREVKRDIRLISGSNKTGNQVYARKGSHFGLLKELRLERGDQSEVWIEYRLSRVEDDLFLLLANDITEQKRIKGITSGSYAVNQRLQKAVTEKKVLQAVKEGLSSVGLQSIIMFLDDSKSNMRIASSSLTASQEKLVENTVGKSFSSLNVPIDISTEITKSIETSKAQMIRQTDLFIGNILGLRSRTTMTQLVESLDMNFAIAAPLFCRDRLFGILLIGGATLLESDVQVAENLGSQIALALANIHNKDKKIRNEQSRRIFIEAIEKVSSCSSPEDTCRQITVSLGNLASICTFVGLFEKKGKKFAVQRFYCNEVENTDIATSLTHSSPGSHLQITTPAFLQKVVEGQVIVRNVENSVGSESFAPSAEDFINELLPCLPALKPIVEKTKTNPNSLSYLLLPIITNNGIFGAFGMIKDDTITEDEFNLAKVLIKVTTNHIKFLHSVTDLSQSCEQFNLLTNQSQSAVLLCDEKGSCLSANRTAENLWGYSQKELLSSRVFNLVKGDLHRDFGIWSRRLKQERRFSEIMECVRADGSIFWANVTSLALSNDSAILVISDLTEKQRIEKQQRYMTAFIKSINDAVITTDLEFVITYWNRSAEELYGWQAETMTDQSFCKLESKDSNISCDRLLTELERNGSWKGLIERKTKTGVRVIVESTVSLISDGNDSLGILHVERDATERLKQLDILEQSESLNRALHENRDDEIVLLINANTFELLYGDKATLQRIGLQIGDDISKRATDLIHEEDLDHFIELLKTDNERASEIRMVDRRGGHLTLKANAKLVDFLSEKVIRLAARDISEMKRREINLVKINTELNTLTKIRGVIIKSLDLTTLLQNVLDELHSDLALDATAVFLRDNELNEFGISATQGQTLDLLSVFNLTPTNHELFTQVIQSDQPIFFESENGTNSGAEDGSRSQIKSIGLVPLWVQKDVVGVLIIGRRLEWKPTAEDYHLYKVLGNSIGLGIKNCQDFEDEKNSNTALQRLFKTTPEIYRELNVDTLLNAALERLPAIVHCDFASIYFVNDSQFQLLGYKDYIEANVKFPNSIMRDEFTPIAQVASLNKPCNIRNLGVEFPNLVVSPWSYTKSYLSIPLSLRETCFGVLIMAKKDTGGFNRIEEATARAYANQISVAVENAKQFGDEQEQIRHFQALSNVSQSINQTLDPDLVLKDSTESVMAVFEANLGEIQIFNSDALSFSRNTDIKVTLISNKNDRNSWIPSEIMEMAKDLKTGLSLSNEQIELGKKGKGFRKKAVAFMKTRNIHSLMIAPIKTEEETIGVICIATTVKRHQFNQHDVTLLCKLANQIGNAVHNAQTYSKVQRQLEREGTFQTRLKIIHSLFASSNQAIDNSDALSKKLHGVLEILEYDASSVYILEPDSDKLTLTAQLNLSPSFVKKARSMAVGKGFCGKAVQLGNLVARNSKEGVRSISLALAKADVQAVIGVPIVASDEILGSFEVCSFKNHDFTDEEIEFLKSVGEKLGAAIRYSRLLMIEHKRVQRLSALCAASRAITKVCSLQETTLAVMRELEVLIPADRTGLYLIGENSDVFKFVPGRGFSSAQTKIIEQTAWERHPGWVIRNKKPLLCKESRNDDRIWYPNGVRDARSLLFVPLLSDEKCIGVLGLSSFRPNAFDNDDLDLVANYANAAVAAIKNAELYQRLEDKLDESLHTNEDIRALQDTLAAAQSTLVTDKLLNNILDGIVQHLNYQVAVLVSNMNDSKIRSIQAVAVNPEIVSSVDFSSIIGQTGGNTVFERIDQLANQAAEAGTPVIVEENENVFKPLLGQSITDRIRTHGGVSSISIVPLRIEERVVSVLVVGSQYQDISDDAVNSLKAFGQQAAFSIASTRRHTELQQHVQEQERINRHYELLSNVAAKAHEGLGSRNIFSIVGHELNNLSLGCAVLLSQEKVLQLTYNSITDIHPKEALRAENAFGIGMFEWSMSTNDGTSLTRSIREGKTLIFEKVDDCLTDYVPELDHTLVRDVLEKLGIERLITAPLVVKKKTLGMLFIFGQDLIKAHIPVVTTLATQLAISIQNAGLYQKSARLAGTIETLNDSVIITDLEGQITFANRESERTYGYKVDELVGKSVSILMANNSENGSSVPFPLTTNNTLRWHAEKVHRRKNGQNFPVEIRSNVIYDEREQPIALLDIIHDISKRKKWELELVNSERDFRRSFEYSLEIILNLDQEGKIIRANRKAQTILGYSNHELAGKNLFSFLVKKPESSNGNSLIRKEMLMDEVSGVELELVAKDSTLLQFEVHSSPVFDEKGRFLFVNCLLHDISQRKELYHKIRESELRHRAIISSANSFIFMMDFDGRFLVFNAPWKTSRKQNKIIGKTPNVLGSRELADELLIRVKKVFKSGQSLTEEMQLDWTGEKLWHIVELSPVLDAKGQVEYVAGNARNIDGQRKVSALHQQKAVFLDQAGIMVFAFQVDGDIIYVNRSTAKALDFSDGQLKGKSIFDLIQTPSKAILDKTVDSVVRYGTASVEVVIRRNKGGTLPISLNLVSVKSTRDLPPSIICVGSDLTEFKTNEVNLCLQNLELQARNTIQTFAAEAENESAFINQALESVIRMFQIDMGTFYLMDELNTKLQLKAAIGLDDNIKEKLTTIPVGGNWPGSVAQSGEVGVFNEPFNESGLLLEMVESARLKTLASIPLIARESIIGVMNFGWVGKRTFSEKRVGVLKALGVQVGTALYHLTSRTELAASERRYRRLVENTAEGIAVFDASGIVTFANQPFSEMFGSLRQVVGISLNNLLSEQSRDTFSTELLNATTGKKIECELDPKMGKHIAVSAQVSPIVGDGGKVVGGFVLTRDITEHKRTQQALERTEERYRLLMEHAPVGIFVSSSDGRLQLSNAQACRTLGISQNTYENTDIWSLVLSEDRGQLKVWWTDRLKNEETEPVIRIRLANSQKRQWIELAITIAKVNGDSIIIGTIVNITDRIKYETDLMNANYRLEAFFEQHPHGAALVDEQGQIIKCNGAYRSLLTGTREGIPIIEDPIITKFGLESTVQKALRGSHASLPPTWLPSQNGNQDSGIAISTDFIPLRFGSVKKLGLSVIYTDFTEQMLVVKKYARKVKLNRELLQQSSVPILVCDIDTNILDVNTAVSTLTGYDRQKLIGMHISDLFASNDQSKIIEVLDSLKKNESKELVANLLCLDKTLPVAIAPILIESEDTKLFEIVFRDISKTEFLQRKYKLVSGQLAAMNQLVSSLSEDSDLNGLFSGIIDPILTLLHCRQAAILLRENNRSVLQLQTQKGLSPQIVNGLEEIDLSNGNICTTALRIGKIVSVGVDQTETDVYNTTKLISKTPSIAIPIFYRSEVVGVILAFYEKAEMIEDIDNDLFLAIGRMVGIGVGKVRQTLAITAGRDIVREFVHYLTRVYYEQDFKGILETTAKSAVKILQAAASSVMLLDKEQKDFYISSAEGLSKDFMRTQRFSLDTIKTLIGSNKYLALYEPAEEMIPNKALYLKENIKSILIFPVFLEQSLVALVVIYDRESKRRFVEAEIDTGFIIANVLALAFQRYYLKEDFIHQAQNVSEMKDIAKALVHSNDNLEPLEIGLNACISTMESISGVIYLFSGSDNSLNPIIQKGKDISFSNDINSLVQSDDFRKIVIKAHDIFFYDLETHPNRKTRLTLRNGGVDNIISIPIPGSKANLGCICLASTEKRDISKNNRERLTAISQNLAIAIQRMKASDEYQYILTTTNKIAKAAQDLSGNQSFSDTVSCLSKHIQNILGAESFFIVVRNHENKSDQVVYNEGVADSTANLMTAHLEKTLYQDNNEICSAIYWPGAQDQHPCPDEIETEFQHQEIKFSIALPLTDGNRKLGAIWAFSKQPKSYSPAKIQLFSIFMHYTSAALVRSMNFDQLDRMYKLNEQIGRTSTEVIIIHDIYGIITFANKAAEKLLEQSVEDILGAPIRRFLSEDYIKRFGTNPAKTQIDRVIEFEAFIQSIDKNTVPVSIRARALYEADKFQGVLLAITEARRIQKAIIESRMAQEKLEYIIKHVPAEYWTIEFRDENKFSEGIVSVSDNSFCEIPIEKFSESDTIKVAKLAPYFSPDSWTSFAAACARAYIREKVETPIEISIKTPENEATNFFSVTIFPLYNYDQLVGVQGFINDITSKVVFKKRAHNLEDRYLNFLTHSDTYVYRIGSEGDTKFLGGAFEGLTRCKQESNDEQYPNLRDLVHNEDVDKVSWTRQQLQRNDIKPVVEFRIVDDKNKFKWLRANNVPLYDQSGNCIGIEGFARDVTNEKRLTITLEEQKKRTKLGDIATSLSEISNEIYWSADSHGVINIVTDSAEKLLGRPVENIKGKHYSEFIEMEKYANIKKSISIKKRVTSIPWTFEQRYMSRNKKEIWLKWQTILLLDKDGKFNGINARAVDITEERKLRYRQQHHFQELEQRLLTKEKEANILEEKYSLVLDNTYSGILISDLKGQIIEASSGVYNILGFENELLTNKNLVELDSLLKGANDQLVESYLHSDEFCRPHERLYNKRNDGQTPVQVQGRRVGYNGTELAILVIRDISQQREHERTLKDALTRLHLFTDKTQDSVITFDMDGSITSINSAGEKFFSIYYQKELGQTRTNELLSLLPKQLKIDLDMVLEDKNQISNLYKVCVGEELPLWMEADWGPLMDDNGVCHGAQVILRDVTEYQRMNEELGRESTFSKTLIEKANIMVVGLGPAGQITLFNNYSENLTGYTCDEVIGKNWFDNFLPPDARPAVSQQFYDLVDKELLTKSEQRIITKDGREKFISWSHSVIRDTSGDNKSIVNIGQDVTEKREIEVQIRESEKKYRALYEKTTNPIFQLDASGQFIDANKAALQFLELPNEDITGKSVFDLFSQRDKMESIWGADSNNKADRTLEVEAEFLIGEKLKALKLTMTPMALGERRVVFSVGTDITEQKQVQNTLERRNKELEALNAVANAVIGKLNLNELLQAALSITLDMFEMHAGGCFFIDEQANEAVLLAHQGLPEKFSKRIERLPLDTPFISDVIESSSPVCTSQLYFGTENQKGSEVTDSLEKLVSTALRIKGKLNGLIFLMIPETRELTVDETGLLLTIGNHVAIAIENANLYEKSYRRDIQLSELVAASRRLTSGLDQSALLKDMMQKALSVVPAANSGVLFACEGNRLLIKESIGANCISLPELELPYLISALNGGQDELDYLVNEIEKIDSDFARRIIEKVFTTVLEEHNPLCLNQVPKFLQSLFSSAEPPKAITKQSFNKLMSIICAPIFVDERFYGFLILENLEDENAFDPIDEDMLGMFVKQMAISLENVQLYDDARRRADTFSAIAEVGGVVTSGDDLYNTLDVLSQKIAEAAGFDAVLIGLYDLSSEQISYRSIYTNKALERLSQREELLPRTTDVPMIERLVKKKEPILLSDAIGDPRVDSEQRELFIELGIKSVAAFPLKFKNKVIGIIEMMSKTMRQFLVEEEELFSILASQIAEAINSANMMEDIKKQRKNLEDLSRRIIRIQEKERGMISRELHDEIGQALTAMIFNLELMQGQTFKRGEDFKRKLSEATKLAEHVIQDVRRISTTLRPAMLDDLGILPTIRWYAANFVKNYETEVLVEASDSAEELPEEIKLLMYRVVQESLTNVAKHANADNVLIILNKKTNSFVLEIIDDGVGFEEDIITVPRPEGTGLGLSGMRERLRLVGGSINIQSHLGKGTRIAAKFPLK